MKAKIRLSTIYILVGISLVVAASFLAAFFWSVKTGQYDDDYSPAVKMLFDDGLTKPSEIKTEKSKSK